MEDDQDIGAYSTALQPDQRIRSLSSFTKNDKDCIGVDLANDLKLVHRD